MPQGEDCPVAKALKNSLMGRLVPLSKFFLLAEDAVHYSDGIEHPDYKSGGFDTFIAIDTSGKKPKALWADPDKQFWRDLSALLAFLANKQGMSCFSLKTNIKRVREQCDHFELWAGGLRVSSNAGEQYATGGDDFVESVLWLSSKDVGRDWFIALQGEIDELDKLSRVLYAAVRGYGRYQKNQDDAQAKKATAMYWQRCNSKAQDLVGTCYSSTTTKVLRREFASFVREAYDSVCPRSTARQWEAWAANTPNLASYLKH
jgi:CRISPR system Cascade subunit CasA